MAQCEAITQIGNRCSRNAEIGSRYCWQHTLIYASLQPGIINKIYEYTGALAPINKSLKDTISLENKNNILNTWFFQIGVKTPFSEVKDTEIPLLWGLYRTRIANAPAKTLLQKAIGAGLDKKYFYSIQNIYNFTLEDPYNIVSINEILKEFITINNIRIGDTVRLAQFGYYRNDGVLIYDGTQLIVLDNTLDEYDNLPAQILINEYPIVDYFEETISHNNIVRFNTNNTRLQLISKFEEKEYSFYKYNTIGDSADYTIFTADPNFELKWNNRVGKNIMIFSTGENGRDEFFEVYTVDTDDAIPVMEDILRSDSSKVLFDYYNVSPGIQFRLNDKKQNDLDLIANYPPFEKINEDEDEYNKPQGIVIKQYSPRQLSPREL